MAIELSKRDMRQQQQQQQQATTILNAAAGVRQPPAGSSAAAATAAKIPRDRSVSSGGSASGASGGSNPLRSVLKLEAGVAKLAPGSGVTSGGPAAAAAGGGGAAADGGSGISRGDNEVLKVLCAACGLESGGFRQCRGIGGGDTLLVGCTVWTISSGASGRAVVTACGTFLFLCKGINCRSAGASVFACLHSCVACK